LTLLCLATFFPDAFARKDHWFADEGVSEIRTETFLCIPHYLRIQNRNIQIVICSRIYEVKNDEILLWTTNVQCTL
jgi:hypothetical protein